MPGLLGQLNMRLMHVHSHIMKLNHLISITDLNQNEIIKILDQAQRYIAEKAHLTKKLNILHDKTVALLFCEPSTRTRCSFELAAKRLGATTLNLDFATSSALKGETLLDTVHTLEAMGVDIFIIRHQDEGIIKGVAENFKRDSVVINAGEGTKSHPTQALLDMLTIRQHKKDFSKLSVAIVGDMRHSRVAHSDIAALQILGVKDIRLIGPKNFQPESLTHDERESCRSFTDIEEGLQGVDVVMTLRIQKERMLESQLPDKNAYFQQYGLTPARLKLAKKDAIVMHPAPLNRGVEIDSAVADGPQSVILQQVENGVAIRMALLRRPLA